MSEKYTMTIWWSQNTKIIRKMKAWSEYFQFGSRAFTKSSLQIWLKSDTFNHQIFPRVKTIFHFFWTSIKHLDLTSSMHTFVCLYMSLCVCMCDWLSPVLCVLRHSCVNLLRLLCLNFYPIFRKITVSPWEIKNVFLHSDCYY